MMSNAILAGTSDSARPAPSVGSTATTYHTANIGGLEVFYREAGPRAAPVLVLLHGFPSSSHMFRDLIPKLSAELRVIAPDYLGFGYSARPPAGEFRYTF